MNSRRSFLSDLAVGMACLCFRFRVEAGAELAASKAVVVFEGEWGGMKYTIATAWKPVRPPLFEPIIVHRCRES